MVYLSAFSVKDEYPNPDLFFNYALNNPKLKFKGYKGTYHYRNIGHAEFSAALIEDQDGKISAIGPDMHLMGNNHYRMKIEEVFRNDEMTCFCVCSPMDGNCTTLPVSLVFSDVLPSILPGDIVFFQGVSFLIDGNFYNTANEAEEAIGLSNLKFMDGELHLASGLSSYIPSKGNEERAEIFTKVKDFQILSGLNLIDDKDFSPIYTVVGTCQDKWTKIKSKR